MEGKKKKRCETSEKKKETTWYHQQPDGCEPSPSDSTINNNTPTLPAAVYIQKEHNGAKNKDNFQKIDIQKGKKKKKNSNNNSSIYNTWACTIRARIGLLGRQSHGHDKSEEKKLKQEKALEARSYPLLFNFFFFQSMCVSTHSPVPINK